ncbi:MAG: class I adenylate-forming enzyme family protein [Pseudomonadota bacterium]
MSQVDTHVMDFCHEAVKAAPEFEIGEVTLDGITYPIFKNAPPSFEALFQMATAEYGSQDFLVYHDLRLTFADADAASRRLAQALIAAGVGRGDRVAIAMRNYPEWMIAYMAITRMGAIAVLMNAWWQTQELDYACGDSGVTWVFADQQRAERLLPVKEARGLSIITVRGEVPGTQSYESFLDAARDDITWEASQPEDHGTIFYTSGSTGHPKGVLMTHRASLNALMNWALIVTADRTVRQVGPAEGRQYGLILTVPLFHVTGCNAMFLLSVLAGQKLVIMDRWNAEEAVRIIEREHITAFNGVPSMSYELAQAASKMDVDLSSIYQISGGGAARPASHVPLIAETFEKVMPSIGYGMSETSAIGTANAGNNYQLKPTSVGIPNWPLVHIKIADDQGNDCSTGEVGEIWIKSITNMVEYLNQPQATAETLQDGYVKSGDVGYLDDDGYLFLVDRKKDIVIRGGENISCQEVEDALYAHAAVQEAAVFGLPDDKLGEQLVAVCSVSTPDCDEAGLQAFVKERLAYYKVPVSIELRQEPLPKTATAKIFKRGLREEALAKLEA